MKKLASVLARIFVSLVLLWYVLSKTEVPAIISSLRGIEPFWVFWALVTLIIGKVLTGYRWQKLLAAHRIKIPLPTLIASLYVGQFFNNFLPSTVGGDAIRAYDTATYSRETAKSIAVVFVDRVIGVSALALLGILAVVASLYLQETAASFIWPIAGVSLGCVIVLAIIFNQATVDKVERLLSRLGMGKVAKKVSQAYHAVFVLSDQKSVLFWAFMISVALQVNVVLFYYLVSLSLGLSVSVLYFFLIIPIVLIILLVPFSINGIGISESAYVFFLGMVGTTAADAIALSWLAFGLMLTQGLVGGLIFAVRGVDIRKMRAKVLVTQADTTVIKEPSNL